jgi:hypothetical protein
MDAGPCPTVESLSEKIRIGNPGVDNRVCVFERTGAEGNAPLRCLTATSPHLPELLPRRVDGSVGQ